MESSRAKHIIQLVANLFISALQLQLKFHLTSTTKSNHEVKPFI